MLLAGDEFARTQHGNNNAYCQDNEFSWLNWDIGKKGTSLVKFVSRLCAMRHKYPILRRNRFLTGVVDADLQVKDVSWINASGNEMRDHEWSDDVMRCFGMLIDGRARPTGVRQRCTEATMLIVLNGHHDLVEFVLPVCAGGDRWNRVLDTNVPEPLGEFEASSKDVYGVTPRSLVLFARIGE
jgi:glycogen operon protein